VDGHYSAFDGCGLVIEAILEDLAAKQHAFTAIEGAVGPGAALATNTSSLSVTAIAASCQHPERVLGVHFFNPAPLMPLVEIVGGHATDPARTAEVRALVDGWGKTTVLAADTPGFIVNRVARPFYGESLRLLEEGVADHATIDWAMREIGGFRMGPFELMDLIGNDINYAVTWSVFEPSAGALPPADPARGRAAFSAGSRAGLMTPPGRGADTGTRLGRRIVDRDYAINEAADAVFSGSRALTWTSP
jgi:3-hydroxybutyryl-CoA dehydrogenase